VILPLHFYGSVNLDGRVILLQLLKTRVAPAGCAIEVSLEGDGTPPADSIEGFNESGTIIIKGVTTAAVGPFVTKK